MAAAAPRQDLNAIEQMRKYRAEGGKRTEVADACMESLDMHQWYLDPSLVVFALVDEGTSQKERRDLALAIDDTAKPHGPGIVDMLKRKACHLLSLCPVWPSSPGPSQRQKTKTVFGDFHGHPWLLRPHVN